MCFSLNHVNKDIYIYTCATCVYENTQIIHLKIWKVTAQTIIKESTAAVRQNHVKFYRTFLYHLPETEEIYLLFINIDKIKKHLHAFVKKKNIYLNFNFNKGAKELKSQFLFKKKKFQFIENKLKQNFKFNIQTSRI